MSEGIQIRGTTQPLRQFARRRYNPDGGFTTETESRTFSHNTAERLFYDYAKRGVHVEWEEAFGQHVLRSVDNRGEVFIDRWEIGCDDISKSEYVNPRNTVFQGLNDHDKRRYKEGVSNNSPWADTLARMHILPTEGEEAELKELYGRLCNGQDYYYASQIALVHTTNAPNRYQRNIADLNVNRLYTHADFLSEILNANLWVFPCPGAIEYALTYFYNDQMPNVMPGYEWTWMKCGSSRTTCANNRVDISTRYKLDQWSSKAYAMVT